MLANIYHIVRQDLWRQGVFGNVEGVIVMQVNTSASELLDCYQVVSRMPAGVRVCLFMTVDRPIDRAAANCIIAFFFLQTYYSKANVPFILVQELLPDLATSVSEDLIAAARAQGFKDISIGLLELNRKNNYVEYLPDNQEEIRSEYRMLLNADIAADGLYIKVSSLEDITSVEALLMKVEQQFQESSPALFLLKKENQILRSRIEGLEMVQEAAKQELVILASHINTLRSASQATHLQNYYTHEYEILPLWYKRFGHVLKVMMGKRSFRSLFNDHVKKYKQ